MAPKSLFACQIASRESFALACSLARSLACLLACSLARCLAIINSKREVHRKLENPTRCLFLRYIRRRGIVARLSRVAKSATERRFQFEQVDPTPDSWNRKKMQTRSRGLQLACMSCTWFGSGNCRVFFREMGRFKTDSTTTRSWRKLTERLFLISWRLVDDVSEGSRAL